MIKEEPKQEVLESFQSNTDQGISDRIFAQFLKWRDNKNLQFGYFRNRNWLDYVDDSNKLFNNYKVKPDWKEPWQSNISDTTVHAKLMAIIAQQVVNQYTVAFAPRFKRDIFSKIRAQVLQDIYDFTESGSGAGTRNGEIDLLFIILKACREGRVFGFEGYRKNKNFEGIDAQLIPIDDYFPSNMKKFFVYEDPKKIWRSIITKDDWNEKFSNWYQFDKVKTRSEVNNEQLLFFNISQDVKSNEVEILRYFDKLSNEFFITANGILIVNPNNQGYKITDRRKDKEDGIWSTVFEAYDDNFLPGRSLPDLMSDAQEGIDFLFNSMFDKEILSVMRPLLIGGVNQSIDNYLRPGGQIQMADITQIKELDFKGADLGAFRILKELQDRQHFVSVDQVSQGVAIGSKTATEVERAQQAAEKLNSVFGVMVKSALVQKGRLRAGTIQQFMIGSDKFNQFVTENVKLFKSGKTGTRTLRITNKPQVSRQDGFSPNLEKEADFMEGGSESNEIFELTPSHIKDFEFGVSTKAPSQTEKKLKSAKDVAFWNEAKQRPDLFDQKESAKDFAEAMDKDPDRVLSKEEQQMMPEEGKADGAAQNVIPSLESMIQQPIQ